MRKRTQEKWLALIEQWKESGKTLAAWCREQNIPKNTLLYWVQKQKSCTSSLAPIKKEHFTELTNQASETASIEIRYEQLHIRLPANCDPRLISTCLKIASDRKC